MGELPEPWGTAAERAGIRQTLRGIADAAGISHVTVRRLINQGRTSPGTISAVAGALRIDPATVYEWSQVEVSEWGPWTPPMQAHKLSPRARAALSELILAIVEAEDETNAPSAQAKQKSVLEDLHEANAEARRAISTQSVVDAGWQRAARRRTTPPKPAPELDAQAHAGEENQDQA